MPSHSVGSMGSRKSALVKKSLTMMLAAIALIGLTASEAAASGTWPWPVVGPVIRAFEPPSSPYARGHRGIDIAAVVGTVVVAPATGVVTFSGSIGSHLYLTLEHGGGLTTTYSWVSALLVVKSGRVMAGQPIARSGSGHPGDPIPNLHFGVKLDGVYVDPMPYLLPPSVSTYIRLAPLQSATAPTFAILSAPRLTHRMAPLWDPPSIWSFARPCAGSRCARAQRSLWALSWRSREPR
jgi:hypothetical protein